MRRALQAAVLAGALVLTSGCALIDRPGAAAIVDGKRLTTQELATDFAKLDTALGKQAKPGTQDQLNRAIITLWVGDILMKKAAAANHVEVNWAAVGKLHRQLVQQLGGAAQLDAYAASKGVPPNLIWTVLANGVLTTDLGAKLVGGTDTTAQNNAANAYIKKLAGTVRIEVSPAYGAWDTEQLTVAAKDDLSTAVSTSATLG